MLSSVVSGRKIGTVRAALSLSFLVAIVWSLLCSQSRLITAAPVPSPGFEGYHDGADCSHIFGWAWESSDPNNAITVDIYSDNVLVATTLADQFREDLLNANKGSGYHAFDIATPNSLKDGLSHSIRVTIGGTNINIGNTPITVNCAGPAYEGFHDFADCNAIAGWVWDSKQPNTPLDVDIYIDDDSFRSITAPANQFRQDLVNAGKGNGFHAFSFPTPTFLKDGHPHSIRIKITGTLTDLGNTSKTINCSSNPPPAFEGFHDGADCGTIFGWVWDANLPNTPISVDIYEGNMLIATIAADQFRQDLANAGKGNGFHAFSLATPPGLKDGQTHTISVGIHDTDIPLGNTFRTITCP